MKRLLSAWSLSLVACASGPPPAKEPPPAAPPPPAPSVPFFEGGGEVVRLPVPGSGQLAVRLVFTTGSADDPPGKAGLTALTARLVAEGGSTSRTYGELLRALYPMAAELGLQVDKELTVFHAVVHPDHARAFAALLAEVLTSPRLDGADFERLRGDQLDDLTKRLASTDDENLGKVAFERLLYGPGHPYAHPVSGTTEALRALTLDDVKAHHARVFGRRRLSIGLGGDVPAEVEAELVAALAKLPEGAPRLAEIPPAPALDRHRVLIVRKPAKAVAISMGAPHGAFRGHPDFPALMLVQSYFGEHRQFHGVLMSELREKRGLNYGDYAYVEAFRQEGWSRNVLPNIARRRQHFELWLRPVDPKDAVFALRGARFYLDRLVGAPFPAEGLDSIRTFLEGYTRLAELTVSRRLGQRLDERFYGTGPHLAGFRERQKSLTVAEVEAAIRTHLGRGPLAIAMVAEDADGLKQALLSGAPSTKAYPADVSAEVKRDDEAFASLPLELAPEDVTIVNADELLAR